MNKIIGDEYGTYINGMIYSCFYVNPLQGNISPSFDLGEILKFNSRFFEMSRYVADESDNV